MLALLLTGFFALTFPSAKAATDTFGKTTKGASSANPSLGVYYGTYVYSPASDGTVTSITQYIKQYSTTTPKIQFAIYDNADNTLVGYTEQWTLTAGWDDWKTLNIVWGGAVYHDHSYILVSEGDSGAPSYTWYYSDTDGGVNSCKDSTHGAFGTWEDACNWDGGKPWTTWEISIYATYTTGIESFSLALNTPANASTVGDYSCDFAYTTTLYGSDSFHNATLYLNGTSVASNSTAIENATSNTISYVLPGQNATYLWDVKVWNSTNALFSTNGNFTLNVAVLSVAATSEEDIIAAVMFSCIVACSVTGVAVYAKKKH